MHKIATIQMRRLSINLISISTLCWLGCVSLEKHNMLAAQFSQFKAEQAENNKTQDEQIKEIAAQSTCPNNTAVRDFIKNCAEITQCKEEETHRAVKAMRKLPHVMFRIPFQSDAKSLTMPVESQVKVTTYIRSHDIVPWITKLLIVTIVPSGSGTKEAKNSKGKRIQIKGAEPSQSAQNGNDVDLVTLSLQARQFRNTLGGEPYRLDSKVLPLPVQVPACNPKTNEIAKLFRDPHDPELKSNKLTPQEELLQNVPHVDVLLFLLEC